MHFLRKRIFLDFILKDNFRKKVILAQTVLRTYHCTTGVNLEHKGGKSLCIKGAFRDGQSKHVSSVTAKNSIKTPCTYII
jgi:hypothetical protein